MGKRSSDFARRPMDDYATPPAAVLPLIPHLKGIRYFAEPCCGSEENLVSTLELMFGMSCVYSGDICFGEDAFEWNGAAVEPFDVIITNPPWTREILHPMILHFQKIAPTWLLFDADWAHTKQAAPYLDQCSHIVAVGRVKWIAESKFTGKDNCAWYRFHSQHVGGPKFFGHPMKEAA